MIKTRIIFSLAGTIILNSCISSAPSASRIPTNEMNDIQKFETLSYIKLIDSGNSAYLNDSLSKKSKINFHESLSSFSNIPITGNITTNDTSLRKEIRKEIKYLCYSAEKKHSYAHMKLTPLLDSLLELSGKRYGLLTITTGFTRAKDNYERQISKRSTLAVITLGSYYQTPIKASSTIYAMIIDAKDNNVAFFRKLTFEDKEPLDENSISRQIQLVFKEFFWTKKDAY